MAKLLEEGLKKAKVAPEVEETEVEDKEEGVEGEDKAEIEKADCCATCMSYKPGRMDSGMCARNMVECKDTNVCSGYTAEA